MQPVLELVRSLSVDLARFPPNRSLNVVLLLLNDDVIDISMYQKCKKESNLVILIGKL